MSQIELPTNYNTIVFAPTSNSPGKSDATGAFIPGAQSFIKYWKLDKTKVLRLIDNTKENMPAQVFQAIENRLLEGDEIKNFIFFCHGYSNGIQFKIRSPRHPLFSKSKVVRSYWETFTRLITKKTKAPCVILFACSTGFSSEDQKDAPGTGDFSFGDLLRDTLCELGAVNCRVFSHRTAGHSWQNPHIVFFDGEGSPYGGVGGKELAKVGSKQFRNLRNKLKKDEFAWKMVFQDIQDIQKDIA